MRETGTLLGVGLLVLLGSLVVAGTAAGVTAADTGIGPTTTDASVSATTDETVSTTTTNATASAIAGATGPTATGMTGPETSGVFGARGGDSGTSNGSGIDPPLADAGLDQTVPRGTTVYLDGGGSIALDGSLAAYSWQIDRPDGSTTTPTCTTSTCVRASFVPTQLGVYSVTLTVTDDSGETASDTLYVIVEKRNPPAAQVTGPDRLAPGEQGTFVLTATPGKAPLSSIRWTVDGSRHDSSFVDGETRWELNHTFTRPGTHTVGGTVTDVRGLDSRDRHTVTVGTGNGPLFLVEIADTNSPIAAGESLDVDATITNVGNESDTQTVTLETFTGDTPDSAAVSLAPGGNTTVPFAWNTTGDDVGDGPVTVASENDTDSDRVTIVPGNGTFFGVTDVDYDWPNAENGSITYTVTYENVGSDPGNQTVEVTQPGASGTLGKHPLQLGAGESATRSYEWKPTGSDGWHDYAGEDVLVVATTADHDRERYVPVPELPSFEVNFTSSHVNPDLEGGFPDDPVSLLWLDGVGITNTGDVAGSRPVEFWAYPVFGSGGKVDRLQDSAELPTGITLDPGENYTIGSYPSGRGQMRWTTPNPNNEKATLEVKTPDDVDAVNVSWSWSPDPPDPEPCSGGDEYLDIEHANYAQTGKQIGLSVTHVYCDNGNVTKDTLSPGQYSISYHSSGSQAGPGYFSHGPDWVKGFVPGGEDDVGIAFKVEYNGIVGGSGARWFRDRDDIPG